MSSIWAKGCMLMIACVLLSDLTPLKGQMSSIWAKGCMLMIACVLLSDSQYLPLVEGESHGILLLLT